MPRYVCFGCGRETGHFNVVRSSQIAQVTRTTIYNTRTGNPAHWMFMRRKPMLRTRLVADGPTTDRACRVPIVGILRASAALMVATLVSTVAAQQAPIHETGEWTAAATSTATVAQTPSRLELEVPGHELVGGPAEGGAPLPDAEPRGPVIGRPLPARVAIKAVAGFHVAVSRLRKPGPCAALFSPFGADGVEKLSRSVYFAASGPEASARCRQDVAAYTWVGDRRTILCAEFGQLPVDGAAVILIHEALHFAGLREQPQDPLGLRSCDINQEVIASCGL